MVWKTVSAIMMFLLVLSTLALTCNVQPVKSYTLTETIYIQANGSIQPLTAPVSTVDNITYTLTGNISFPTYVGIVVQRSNIVINGNGYTVQGNQSGNGLSLTALSNVTIKNVNIQHFQNGIYLSVSSNNIISGNNATANSASGISVYSSNNNTVSGNNATANGYCGILLYSSSSFNTVCGNTGSNNSYCGIYLDSSSGYNTVGENTAVANSYHGILLYSCPNNTVSGNDATANSLEGIYLILSSNNTVSGNTASANQAGIMLYSSSYNIICANNARANVYQGFEVDSSLENTLIGNNASANGQYGTLFDLSSNNTVYHNNLVNNTCQACNYNSTNAWDYGYPFGGNYWSDYIGTDLFRGANQNVNGSDGIGDSSYTIDVNNRDHYPLMGPCGSTVRTGSNVTVYPSQDVGLIFSNVTAAGTVVLNKTLSVLAPPLGNLTGEYYDIKVTASISGKITVRIIYDASNMTQQRESNLTMMQYTPIPGDIQPSFGQVDMRDIGYIARRFGINSTDPLWDPAADITGPLPLVPDGKIDMRDIGLVARNFGKTSQWTNITTYVDTTNNVIYGETTHFSIIAIH